MEIPLKEEVRAALDERHTKIIQEKISTARVAICGLGGLGSNIAVFLARTGIECLHLIDFDTVELSNLNRQQYGFRHLGQYKTHALKEIIAQIAPYCRVITTTMKLNSTNISKVLEGETMVCEAFDMSQMKALLVNYILENSPDTYIVAASGMSGYGKNNQITTRKINSHFYLCGDGVDENSENIGLMAPRVALCAAHQANQMLELIIEKL